MQLEKLEQLEGGRDFVRMLVKRGGGGEAVTRIVVD